MYEYMTNLRHFICFGPIKEPTLLNQTSRIDFWAQNPMPRYSLYQIGDCFGCCNLVQPSSAV